MDSLWEKLCQKSQYQSEICEFSPILGNFNKYNICLVVSCFNEHHDESINQYTRFIYEKGKNQFKETIIKSIKENNRVRDLAYQDEKKIIHIPNIGFEAQTFLYHIITNYYQLQDYLIFIPGGFEKSNHSKIQEFFHKVDRWSSEDVPYYYPLWPKRGKMEKGPYSQELWVKQCHIAFKDIFQRNMSSKKEVHLGAKFIVKKEAILQHPLSFYKNAIKYVNYKTYEIRNNVPPFWSYCPHPHRENDVVSILKRNSGHKNPKNLDWPGACFFEFIWEEMFRKKP